MVGIDVSGYNTANFPYNYFRYVMCVCVCLGFDYCAYLGELVVVLNPFKCIEVLQHVPGEEGWPLYTYIPFCNQTWQWNIHHIIHTYIYIYMYVYRFCFPFKPPYFAYWLVLLSMCYVSKKYGNGSNFTYCNSN